MRTGRPKLPEDLRLSEQVGVRFTKGDLARLEADATTAGVEVADLVRIRATERYKIGWGTTRHVFDKKLDGTWLCEETGEVRTDEQMKPCGHFDVVTIEPYSIP